MRNLVSGWRATIATATVALWACVAAAPAQAAEEHCPSLRTGGAALAWGINADEQTGAGFASNYENSPQPVLGLGGATSVKAGFKFGLALLDNCTLRSWGSNEKGQLGNGTQQTEGHPVTVEGLSEVKEIAVANAHAMALLYNGTVWTWGASEFGERGNKEKGFERTARESEPWFVARDKPAQVPNLTNVRQIAAGGTRDYALLSNGEVMAWGDDSGGLLGVEESSGEEEFCYGETHTITPVQCSTIPRPVKVHGLGVLTGVERIGAAEEDAYAVRNDGQRVLAWGVGGKGELGDGEAEDSPTPVRALFEAPSPVLEVAGGGQHVLVRLADGEVYAWGADGSGQLGFETGEEPTESCGHNDCSTVPAPVLALSHVVGLAAGEGVSFAVKEEEGGSNVIYAFGGTGPYELLGLGNVSITGTASPTAIEGLPSAEGISASTTSAVALLGGATDRQPRLALKAGEETLTTTWDVAAPAYKLRDRPVGTREFSKTLEGSCSGECELALSGLRTEPYEVILKNPEGKEEKEKSRKAFASPLPPKGWPVNTSPPTITGAPATETGKLRDGQKLTASPGSWSGGPTHYAYRWLRCEGQGEAGSGEELGSECEPITVGSEHVPATGETYEVQAADVASSIIVTVEAQNAAGTTVAVSTPEVILAAGEESEPPYPTFTSRPTVTGPAVEGRTLTAHHGAWENSPTSYEDKWYHCKSVNGEGIGANCGPITFKNGMGETEPVIGETYALTTEDVGLWIEVQERATNPGGWEVATSEAVQIAPDEAPSNTAAPTISGNVEQGQLLTEHEGSWTNAATKPRWQWIRCNSSGGSCTAISKNGTNQTRTVTPRDVGHTLEVTESVENGVARTAPVSSAPTVVVPTPPSKPPRVEKGPTISGQAEQGRMLTGRPATWTGEPRSYAYQWKRCESGGLNCQGIKGATSNKYELVRADVGKTLEFRETATNAAGSEIATSGPSNLVAGAVPEANFPPTITGYAVQGRALNEVHGSWSNEAESFTYQWERCNGSGNECEAISGATGRSYTPKGPDVGSTIRVQETASNATGAGTPSLSAPSHTVTLAVPMNIKAPTVSGTGREGETLTASAGTWRFSPTRRSDQWLRCEESECRLIEGATKSTYVVGKADVGYAVAVREAAANVSGWSAAISEAIPVGGTPVPFVTSLEPDAGPTGGGTVVTINGGNLEEASAVAFGFAAAASFEVVTPSMIKAVAPSGSAGTIDVTVTTPKGTSAVDAGSRYTYGFAPTATGIEPKEGLEAGGAAVTITGTNLGEATAVKFGTADAESFGVQSATEIIAVAPAGNGTVGVTVQTLFGSTVAGSGEQFTYVQSGVPPAVKKLSLRKGPAAGGTTLTITGSNFTYANAVEFGAEPAASFKVLSQSSISAESPPGTSGDVDVRVVSPFGESEIIHGDRFRYENPIITSVSPEEGPLGGGTIVTITGSGFAPGEGKTTFEFKKSHATAVECPSTSECVMITPASEKEKAETVAIKADANGKKSSTKTSPHAQFTYEE